MLIVTTVKHLDEKPLSKKYFKVLAIDGSKGDIKGMKNTIVSREFLPDPVLFMNYINGTISKKRYKKEYLKELSTDIDKTVSIITMMIAYRRGDKIVLACRKDEKEYLYLDFLAEYISDRYGIKLGSHKDAKDEPKNKLGDPKRLEKDIKHYADELEEMIGYKDKKKKKKKKDKDKKKGKNKKKGKDKKKDSKKKKKKDKSFDDKHMQRTIEDNVLGYTSDEYDNSDIEIVKSIMTKKLFKNR